MDRKEKVKGYGPEHVYNTLGYTSIPGIPGIPDTWYASPGMQEGHADLGEPRFIESQEKVLICVQRGLGKGRTGTLEIKNEDTSWLGLS